MRLPLAIACLLTFVFIAPASAILVGGMDPYDPMYSGASYSGVVRVNLGGNGLCTGSLFGPSNIYVLTAAHCLTDSNGAKVMNLANYSVAFDTASQTALIDPISAIYIAPGYAGSSGNFANDLAVVQLQNVAPSDAQSYSVVTANIGDIGREVRLVGQGGTGNGNGDPAFARSPSTDRRNRIVGLNDYEVYADGDNTHILWDFDNGSAQQNAFRYENVNPLSSTGRGAFEATISGGDSGGPSFDFTTGQIVGVHSYITCFVSSANMNVCASPPDLVAGLPGPGGYFGELGADTRVSLYGEFLAPFNASAVPEPGTWALAGSAAFLLFAFSRKLRA